MSDAWVEGFLEGFGFFLDWWWLIVAMALAAS
jgi:hypothetical protein